MTVKSEIVQVLHKSLAERNINTGNVDLFRIAQRILRVVTPTNKEIGDGTSN